MANLNLRLALFFLLCSFPQTLAYWWSRSSSSSETPSSSNNEFHVAKAAEFSMQAFSPDAKAIKVMEDASRKMLVANTCWNTAYRALMESCAEIAADEEKQRRLAWLLSNCFQTDSGRPAFPACKQNVAMVQCLKRLDDSEHKVFLEFFLETNNICYQLQSKLFKQETEMAVNHLVNAAHSQINKLDIMDEKSNKLLQDANQALDLMSAVQERNEQSFQITKDIEAQVRDVLENSDAMMQQSKKIAASQLELKEAQVEMIDGVKTGMTLLQESHESLGKGIDNLMRETVEIEREVKMVGESMVSKMQELQGTANNIESVASLSLEKQWKLIDGQSEALDGLDSLRRFQSEALKESRETLEMFSEYGHKQHEELLQKQGEIQKTHDHLYQTSQAILEAQRQFELKQSDIFSMLEKLYALYKAILDESRFIKGFFFYACIIFLLYMLTSAKQTFNIRAYLYLGLCVTLVLEMAIIKLGINDIIKNIWLARSTFVIAAMIQILYSIFTFRDYEILSHQLLQALMEKVSMLEQNSGYKSLRLAIDSDDDDDRFSDYSWIEEELPEEVDINEDPNYFPEEVAENFNVATLVARNYHLRPRPSKKH